MHRQRYCNCKSMRNCIQNAKKYGWQSSCIQRFWAFFYAYFRKRIPHEEAEDLAQEAILLLPNICKNFDEKRSAKAYATAIARNGLIKYYSNKKPEVFFDKVEMAYTTHNEVELRDLLDKAMQSLSPEEKKLTYLKYFKQYNRQQIKEKMSMPIRTQNFKLKHIRSRMRAFIERQLHE